MDSWDTAAHGYLGWLWTVACRDVVSWGTTSYMRRCTHTHLTLHPRVILGILWEGEENTGQTLLLQAVTISGLRMRNQPQRKETRADNRPGVIPHHGQHNANMNSAP